MARTTSPLRDTACRTAKPREREYKLFDGDGLYLLVQPNGRKDWRLRYVKPDGREGLTALSSYPVIRLFHALAPGRQKPPAPVRGHPHRLLVPSLITLSILGRIRWGED